jgi:hypothetical protein
MTRWVIALVLLLGLAGCGSHASDQRVSFYLQLVRGNDRDEPPTSDAKPVGPVLADRLQSVFKWKNYWELSRDAAVVKCGEKVCRSLSPERKVEIELLSADTMKVRVYVKGHLSRCRTQPVQNAFYIAGGDKDSDESWFVVVRRDAPQLWEPQANAFRKL